jgi:UDP-N-acetylglucosamine 2-epimerase (non-hydrolysing)
MKLIDLIAGARPNFMKIAPILHAYERDHSFQKEVSFRLIHTGQHFDTNMSDLFFEQLNIRKPDIYLNCGGGSQAEQTGKIMVAYEKLLSECPSDFCIVVGDVNSTMACTIVAKKMNIRVAHVEAGIRSGDMAMPEEINRIVTDSIADIFFTTTENAGFALKKSGVEDSSIFLVGNTMIDTLIANLNRLTQPSIWIEAKLEQKKYFLLTLHRPSNVDHKDKLESLLKTVISHTNGLPIIFPVHPRTRKTLQSIGIEAPNLFCVEPMGYLEFIYLVKNAVGVITDSGGITEETTVLGIPCITLRNSTERPETVEIGTNVLVGDDEKQLASYLDEIIENSWKKGSIPKYWDGNTSERIISCLKSIL